MATRKLWGILARIMLACKCGKNKTAGVEDNEW